MDRPLDRGAVGDADHRAVAHQRGVERDRRVVGRERPCRHAALTSGSPLASASAMRADGQARLGRQIGQLRHEGAVDERRAAGIDAAEQLAGLLGARLGGRIRRRRPAAWPRASARADRCISIPRRAGAAGRRVEARERRLAQRRDRALARQRAARRRIGVGQRLLGGGLDRCGLQRSSRAPPRPGIARSPWPRARAPAPCRRSSRRGLWPARARRPARCSSSSRW